MSVRIMSNPRNGSADSESESAKKRWRVVQWLNALFPDLNMLPDATEEELRAQLIDGTVLCAILSRKNPAPIQSQRGVFISTEQRWDNLKRFFSSLEEIGVPRFKVSDLERGTMSGVVECLLSLRDRLSTSIREDGVYDITSSGSQRRKKWSLAEGDRMEPMDASRGNQKSQRGTNSPLLGNGRRKSFSDLKFQQVVNSPVMPEASSALLHHVGNKFHEVFQLKQGRYSDLPAAKISEMMKSNSLDNAPTQSLLSVVNGILDESIERKNEEIPHRVACLLRKVVQEIERRISTQAEHLRNQKNLIKAREEKYQSRIRVLEALASGTNEETQMVTNQLQMIKTEKTKMEEGKKYGDQDMVRLMKEKEDSDGIISELKREIETIKKTHESCCQQFEKNAQVIKTQVEESKKNDDQYMVMLMKEKKDRDRTISELKHEIEMTKKMYESRCQQLENNAQAIKRELEESEKNGDQDMVRLMKEKEDCVRTISELKQEIEVTKQMYESRCQQLENNAQVINKQLEESMKICDQDMVRLMKEKEDSDRTISELKHEIEMTKKTYETCRQQLEKNTRVIKTQLEETKNNGDPDMVRLMKEKEDSDRTISELKQEIEMTKKTYESCCQQLEKNAQVIITQLEESKNNSDQAIVSLMKEKEDNDRTISEMKHEIEMTKNMYESRCQQLEKNAQVIMAQLEDGKKNGDLDMVRLMKDKENRDRTISELKHEIEMKKNMYESRCQQLEKNAQVIMAQLEEGKKNDLDMVRLMKDKEDRDRTISELKHEIEMTKKTYESRCQQLENDAQVIITQLEESKKNGERDMARLMKEKEDKDLTISEMKQEIEMTKKTYESRCQQLENNAQVIITQLEESKKNGDQDMVRLMKEKEDSDRIISELKQEIEMTKKTNESRCQQLENNAQVIITQLEESKKNSDRDMVRLMKEKEDKDLTISEMKQEIQMTKKTYESRCQQLENDAQVIITQLEESKKNGERDMARLMKEKEDKDLTISEMKQEIEMTKKTYESRCQQLENDAQVIITQLEESKKNGERDMARLMKEKGDSDRTILELKQEIEMTKTMYETRCHQLENNAQVIKIELEEKIKDADFLLLESRKSMKELEAFSESKFQIWNKKEHAVQNFIGFQLESVKNLRLESECIKHEVIKTQNGWKDEMSGLGVKLKVLVDAAENYHTVLAENKKLFNEVQDLKGNIRVYCRIRPFLPGQNGKSTTIDYIGENGEVLVVNPSKQGKDSRRLFKFNKAFGQKSTQEQVYLDIQPLVRSVLDGYNVCIFAYGQTGSGKTYTMMGPNSPSKEEWGVNYRALDDLFQISRTRNSTFLYEVCVQMVEIYNEQVRDLLSSGSSQKRLGILNTSQANGLAVPDATMLPVKSTSDVLELMQFGLTNRAMSATALNERSSRSHSVVTIHVRSVDLKTGSTSRGCLHLVDLAGSERVDRSEVTGDRLKEAQHINKSLSALGDVIFALSQKSSHIPYRNSKLTQLLQSSLGGQAKTLMFVQVNPDAESYSETTSTLKFAERVSGVELGAARSTKEGKDVRELMEQVASLKDTIARKDEEIEHLQLIKDQLPDGNNSLNHSFSSRGISSLDGMTQRGQRSLGGRAATSTDKAASDTEEYSDRHSEAGSLQSVDDLKHQKESLYQQSFNGEEVGEGIPVDDLSGFDDADSEDRLSDISGGASAGAETDFSERAEFTHLPENGKPSDIIREKMPKPPSRVTRPLSQRTGLTTTVRPKLRDPTKSTVPRRSTTSQTTASSVKPTPKR